MRHDDDGELVLPNGLAFPKDINRETQRQVQPPPLLLDADSPVNRSLTNKTALVDLGPNPGPVGSGNVGWWAIPIGASGLAFGGFLCPGAVALMVPNDKAQPVRSLAANTIDTLLQHLCAGGPSTTVYGPSFPDGSFLLRPGEAVNFGRRAATGFTAIFFVMWSDYVPPSGGGVVNANAYMHPAAYPSDLNLPYTGGAAFSPFMNIVGQAGPAYRPYIRVFTEEEAIPLGVTYYKVPYQRQIALTTFSDVNWSTASTYTVGRFAFLPVNTGYVTLAVTHNTAAVNPSTNVVRQSRLADAGGIAAFNAGVRWLMPDGLFHEHPSDQWNAAGVGQVSATHDAQVYQVPRCAIGVQMFVANSGDIPGGVTPYVSYIFTEA